MIRYKQLWTVEAAFGTAKHGTPIQKNPERVAKLYGTRYFYQKRCDCGLINDFLAGFI
jgi:hypothetical protein